MRPYLAALPARGSPAAPNFAATALL